MLFLILFSLTSADSLSWTDPSSSAAYSWDSLQRPYDQPWKVNSGDAASIYTLYVFNFGQNVPQLCGAQDVAALEVVQMYDDLFESCDILGRKEMITYDLIKSDIPEAGFKITYQGGDLCYDGFDLNRQITFKLHCSEVDSDWEVVEESGSGTCHVFLSKNTPFGCPISGGSSGRIGWWWLIGICALFWLYFAGGMALNFLRGKTGDDMIPHYAFWVTISNKLQEFVGLATTKAKSGIESVKEKIAKRNTNYEMV